MKIYVALPSVSRETPGALHSEGYNKREHKTSIKHNHQNTTYEKKYIRICIKRVVTGYANY